MTSASDAQAIVVEFMSMIINTRSLTMDYSHLPSWYAWAVNGHGYTHKVHESNMGSTTLIAELSHIKGMNNII